MGDGQPSEQEALAESWDIVRRDAEMMNDMEENKELMQKLKKLQMDH